jgi:hypothetical protein
VVAAMLEAKAQMAQKAQPYNLERMLHVISSSDSLCTVKSIAKQNSKLVSQLRESRWNKIVVENPSISRPFQPNPRSLGVLRRAGDVLSVSVHLQSFTNERVEETSFIFVGLRFPSLY